MILNDVQQCKTQKGRTGGMQENPVLKAGLSYFLDLFYKNLLQLIKNKGTYWSYNGLQFLIRSSFAYPNDSNSLCETVSNMI